MIFDDEASHQVSYWPSVSDLFMTLFIVAIAIVGSVLFVFLPNPTDKAVVATIIPQINDLRSVLGTLPKIPEGTSGNALNKAVSDTIREAINKLLAYQKTIKELGEKADSLMVANEKIQSLEQENTDLQKQLDRLTQEFAAAQEQHVTAQKEIKILRENTADLEQKLKVLLEGKRLEDRPPIITIADADKRHFFASGSAALTPGFDTDLRTTWFEEIAAEVLRRNSDGKLNVDTLEVIGHTDGVPVSSRGNLDTLLPSVLGGDVASITRLEPGSNNDLGLLRALAIKRVWQHFVSEHPQREHLEPIGVRTYSAGQTLPVKAGSFGEEDARSRRIELRLTKLH